MPISLSVNGGKIDVVSGIATTEVHFFNGPEDKTLIGARRIAPFGGSRTALRDWVESEWPNPELGQPIPDVVATIVDHIRADQSRFGSRP